MRTYLGDGVYVRFDGYQLVLEANNESGSPARIYVDPQVFDTLNAFAERVWKRQEPADEHETHLGCGAV